MDTNERDEITVSGALVHSLKAFFRAPFRPRTYANLLYLALALPLGLVYFIFLSVGLPLGAGLTIVWIGIPILALVLAGSWGLAALERQMAIHALGAEVPPMTPPAPSETRTGWQQVKAFLSNPVTWKGMAFLVLKLPLGIVSFTALVGLLATSAAFLLAPVLRQLGAFEIDGLIWSVDSPGAAWMCSLLGLGLLFVSLNLLNGLAAVWRWAATFLLGSERFATVSSVPPTVPAMSAA